ncbi:SLC13 family permease [Cytophagaceae bacterium ABcell3]|nr:SLC13 family permease [Cytophagaceae bacterium ABcell3]
MDAIILAVIIAGALILFISEIIRVDVIALLIMSSLVATGVLSPAEAIEGFSNRATVTVLFMFILSAALLKTGALTQVGVFFARMFKKNYTIGLMTMMLFIAGVSAFINNTPVVALFIPILIQTAKEAKISSSKLLIPLSFASIFGGMCTLIGSSTNILVDGVARQHGEEGFTMFTLAPAGVTLLFAGMLYMMFAGRKLLPDRKDSDSNNYHLRDYIIEIELFEDARSSNKRIREAPLVTEYEMDILEVIRGEDVFSLPSGDFILKSGDILKVRSNVERLQKLKDKLKIKLHPPIKVSNYHFASKDTSLVELIITSNSRFESKTMQEVNFRQRYRAIPLAIKHREDILHDRLMDTKLRAGDIVLVEIKNNRLDKLKEEEFQQNQPFLLLTEHKTNSVNWKNFSIIAGCLLGIVLLSSFNIMHVLGGTLIAAAIIVITGCIPVKEIYDVVDWKVIVLLAGALSLGLAMEKTGLSTIVAGTVVESVGFLGPIAILSALYLLTSLLTEIMSNNASAALIAPIAISTAHHLEMSAMPFLIAVTLAASASFMTPVGYQTNTMIYGVGGYKFSDFTKVGIGLNLMFWILATIVIPLLYNM